MPEFSVQALDFTDGDTFKRFTVAAKDVTSQSAIAVSCQRQPVADVDDYGWVFLPTVASIGAGTFDVTVVARVGDADAQAGEFPNEIVFLNFILY